MHLRSHQFPCSHNYILAFFACEVAVDILGIFQEVSWIPCEVPHLFETALKILCLFNDLRTQLNIVLQRMLCSCHMLTDPCSLTSLYSASWLLLVGMEWTKHSRMMHSDISSQIRSPKISDTFFWSIETSEENKRNAPSSAYCKQNPLLDRVMD